MVPENGKSLMILHLVYLTVIGLLVLLIISMGLLRNTAKMTLTRIGFAPTKAEIRSALGEPSRVISAGKAFVIGGAVPAPPQPEASQEVWVYTKLMKLTFVYFGPDGRAQMIFYSTT